ncbi:hypothetical protein [Phaeobacter sp. HF9A]|uniref:hypothetical protein n=1 Tax=Phaeobacter sp. HF9A TaxID=2721561 RepID=UPI001430EF9E|nr:hypothetical protein [Phaeobacter sp. HF9A]NIZ12016.1 hypothetical protein [Phaeobacter sp. HF9A]
MAANVLVVAIVALTLVAVLPRPQQSTGHSQPPQGPDALVDALWLRLHPGTAAIYDLDDSGLHLVSSATDARQAALLFVLSQRHYDQVPARLRQTGATWIEITVPEGLGTQKGWRAGFLALGTGAVSRADFTLRLADLLQQGAGPTTAQALRLPPASTDQRLLPRVQILLARLGNGVGFLIGLGALMVLHRRLKRRSAG